MRLRPLLLGLVLLLAASLLAACGDEEDGARAGDIVRARHDDQFKDGRKSSVTVPVGRLLLRVAKPVESADAEQTRELAAVDAPAGGALVPITWQYDPWSAGRFDAYLDADVTPVLTLVTEEGDYRLPVPDRDRGQESFYVAVDGDARKRHLEVEFDGVTQTVNLANGKRRAGKAKALYAVDDARPDRRACESPPWFREPGAGAQFTCDLVGPVRLPYAAGKWAPDGKSWLVVTLTTELRLYGQADPDGGGANYTPDAVTADVRLDDMSPESVLSAGADDRCPQADSVACGYSKHLIFLVAEKEPGPLAAEQTYRMALLGRWGGASPKDRIKVKASRTIKLWD